MNQPTFTVTLQPVHRPDDPDGWRRLRALLKCALRSFSLRCTKVEQVKEGPEKPRAAGGADGQ